MFSLESLHRGNSNEYKKHTIFNIKRKSHYDLPLWDFCKGLERVETAVVDEPSVLY